MSTSPAWRVQLGLLADTISRGADAEAGAAAWKHALRVRRRRRAAFAVVAAVAVALGFAVALPTSATRTPAPAVTAPPTGPAQVGFAATWLAPSVADEPRLPVRRTHLPLVVPRPSSDAPSLRAHPTDRITAAATVTSSNRLALVVLGSDGRWRSTGVLLTSTQDAAGNGGSPMRADAGP